MKQALSTEIYLNSHCMLQLPVEVPLGNKPGFAIKTFVESLKMQGTVLQTGNKYGVETL